jgi:DNA primase
MGGFKESMAPTSSRGAWTPTTRTDGRSWVDASPSRRCAVCGGDSWCQTHREGGTVLCKRVGNGGREKMNRDGVMYWVHRLSGPVRESMEPLPPAAERAPLDRLDAAYTALLSGLRLDPSDRAGLLARGLDASAIDAGGYRSLPIEGRARLARAVVDAVGEDTARAVPGIVWKTSDEGRGWWSLGGSPGLLVTVRDLEGRIVALKVRRRDAEPGHQRYLYLSSARAGGASALAALHVPVVATRQGAPLLVITEGELKADVATHLLGAPVVGLPGVSSYQLAVAHAAASGARRVAVAFDMDGLTNRFVARASRQLVTALRSTGLEAEVWRWDPTHKGIDDMLLAQREGVRHG